MATSTSQGRQRHRTLPLRPLELRGAPYAKRALAWSPDAELAVAIDDSVYVLVPQWATSAEEAGEGERDEDGKVVVKPEDGDGDDNDNDDDDDNDNGNTPLPENGETESRSQFATGSLHIPIAHPLLHPHLNDRLFEAAEANGAREAMGHGDDDEEEEDNAGPGPGLISASGSTMRSVVAVAWSPEGVGHNLRPVLGVLAADGVLAVYGEADGSSPDATTTTTRRIGSGNSYDTARWSVLWAVGGTPSIGGNNTSFCLPRGRRRGRPDRIVSFCWSGPLRRYGPTSLSALLVYATARNEIVIVSVGRWPATGAWRVEEVGRFDATGPHTAEASHGPGHPHFVPSGTGIGVHCSPFAVEHNGDTTTDTLSCVVAYLANGHIGFRRVAVLVRLGEGPTVVIDDQDADGLCLFLGADAFLVWEPAVRNTGDHQFQCRGIVATPMVARAFEVSWRGDKRTDAPSLRPHARTVCNTVYPPPSEQRTNPIQDLIVLPPAEPPDSAPLYMLVRQSATATNDDWYESNVPAPVPPSPGAGGDVDTDRDHSAAHRPQWADDILKVVNTNVPAAIARMSEDEDGEDVVEGDYGVVDGEGDGEGEGDSHGSGLQALAISGPADDNVYLHRMRLWGLACAPGRDRCAVTAVLVTGQPAQHADRGGWYRDRSRVLFGWSRGLPATARDGGGVMAPPVSAEARMWAWMYGDGEDPLAAASTSTTVQAATGEHPLVATQRCSICGASLAVPEASASPRARVTTIACTEGHVFDRCGATGLAIPQPGVSRVCGVCGSRTLRSNVLGAALAMTAAPDEPAPTEETDAPAWLQAALQRDVCGRCGGKFHDP